MDGLRSLLTVILADAVRRRYPNHEVLFSYQKCRWLVQSNQYHRPEEIRIKIVTAGSRSYLH